MKKKISLLLVLALIAVSLCACSGKKEDKPAEGANSAQTAEVPDDSPYKLVMVEEPKPSGQGAPAAGTAEAADNTADTSDPYKQAAGGGDTSDPYKQAAGGGDTSDPYKQAAGGGDTSDPYKAAAGGTSDPYKAAAGGDTTDPYKAAGGGDTTDPYKAAGGGDTTDPYKAAGGGDTTDPYKAAGGGDTTDPYKAAGGGQAQQATEAPAPEEPAGSYIPEPGEGAKYTVAVTDDGWVKIENEGGETLGLSQTSGVRIVEDDGFAFKDLNQNGTLDVYEDWRIPAEDRSRDLVNQMQGVEMASILAHGGWGDFTTDPLTEEDGSATYLRAGGRGGVTRNLPLGGGEHAKWANEIQTVAESCYYGIPAMLSIDPINVSGMVEGVALAATMDPELAAEIGKETAKEYRAAGVTAFLGPQVDIASPVMERAYGTFGEDPRLTRDLATAYVNAMQSTYDESGTDLGWGEESVYCFTKHFAGAGSIEGGRNDHAYAGRYAIFPGNNFGAHLITYFDGVFSLPGLTKSSGIMTEYAVNVDGNGEPFTKTDWAGAYNPYQYGMLKEFGYDGLTISDWGVFGHFGPTTAGTWSTGIWGTEDMTVPERIALCWERGGMLLGGYGNMDDVKAAWDVLVNNLGEEEAKKTISNAAYHYIRTMMDLNMFDLPYCDSAYAATMAFSDESNAYGVETQKPSVVMLKNDGTIKESGSGKEKPTVYVPYIYTDGFSVTWTAGIVEGAPSWNPGMDLEILGQYFEVVTDTLGEPSGEPDADGNPTYTKDDLTRASKEEIERCDYVLVGMNAAYSVSYNARWAGIRSTYEVPDEDVYYPPSLQYETYTADTAIDPSVSGVLLEDGTRENRTTRGNTAHDDVNYGSLEALKYAVEAAGDIPVIVSMNMRRDMVWSEVEPLADVILVSYNSQQNTNIQKNEAVAEIILGRLEPTGLLVFQQPKDMEAVEKQVSDVPRDMECYVDAAGNTYDFAFGLNWAGVIDDERVKTYSAEPLTTPEKFDYTAYDAAYAESAEAAAEDSSAASGPYVPVPGEEAKYTVEVTADGWIRIENEDGEALGLSQTSGVRIVEDDGFAFKDLNRNGQLDVYEDWRKSSEERAMDLTGQMEGAEMASILAHGGWGDFTTEPLAEDDGSATYLRAGGRGGVTRNLPLGGEAHAKWANAIQEVAESCYYGIPAMISIDPINVSGMVEGVALAATMDPQLAADIGKETAKEYRASGVTAFLGPQVDIASPVMERSYGTFGEDPKLTLDITTAYVDAMQSTYDESGEDLGWGDDSVYCFTKHFAGAGSIEGGRNDHAYAGRYAIFPGDDFGAHLITYFDGVFSLPGLTKSSGIMTEYAVNVNGNGDPFTETDWAGAYNMYQYGMLDEFGYDGLTISDWGVFGHFGPTTAGDWSTGIWGTEELSVPERIALCWERGGMLLGGYGNMEDIAAAWDVLVSDLGEEPAREVIANAAYHYIRTMMDLNMFDLPYCDSAYAATMAFSDESNAYGVETQRPSVVMLKNDGTIKEGGSGKEKPTVYVPYIYTDGFSVTWTAGIVEGAPSWNPGMDLEILGQYFEVVTDTLGEPSGEPNADGNPTYTKDDLTRASKEEIEQCDYVLVGMNAAYSVSYNARWAGIRSTYEVPDEDTYYPPSLQYETYTADTAIDPSVSGVLLEDGTRENRTTRGNTAHDDVNYGSLEALKYAAEAAGDVPVIVSMNMRRGMVWTDVEPLADVILVSYNSQQNTNIQKNEAVAEIILGRLEPTGLLVFQQPKDMEAVEKQVSDVPRDMECYVDTAGNTYDFAYGLNWSGVINDERVSTYSAEPLTSPEKFDYAAYEAANAANLTGVSEEASEEVLTENGTETVAG